MPINPSAIHHMHTRKRVHINLEEYPNPNKLKHFVDKLLYLGGFGVIILTFPQIYLIWFKHNASGVSLISWLSYAIVSLIWIFYGYLHKERVLIVINIGAFLINIIVAIGVIVYG